MRPKNNLARERLDAVMLQTGLASAITISEKLGVSVQTLHRILHERGDQIVRLGSTKRAQFALRRLLRGKKAPIPVYLINTSGQGTQVGFLDLIAPAGSLMQLQLLGLPIDQDYANGVWDGLPYPLYDMRPQGYLGRIFARQVAQYLDVPTDPERWSDDHIVDVLSRLGADTPGNLIVGDNAYTLWLQSVSTPALAIKKGEEAECYPRLANEAIALIGMGSSAGGEFPKFTTQRELTGSNTTHVIVKFSGGDDSTPVRRWSDLLVCEYLALKTLQTKTELLAAKSRILMSEGRTFLEVERFDRCGQWGRLPLISLASLDAAFIGSGNADWPQLIENLVSLGFAPKILVQEVLILWWFGRLIGNTDMHLGNLSFQLNQSTGQTSQLILAPAYDMLPMLYAPLSGGEVPVREFIAALPLPQQTEAWQIAYTAALSFWELASQDKRISGSFREICKRNHDILAETHMCFVAYAQNSL